MHQSLRLRHLPSSSSSVFAAFETCSKMRFTLDDHRLVVQLGKNRRERFLFLGNEQLHHFIN